MRSLPATLRWGACFTIAIGLHAAGAAAWLARWDDSADQIAKSPVIMIDLAPVAAAPTTTPVDTPPDPVASRQQTVPEPAPEEPPEITETVPEPEPDKPKEAVDVKPAAVAELELAMLPPPRPVIEAPAEKRVEKKNETRKKKRQRVTSLAAVPSAADRRAERAAAPAPGTAAHNPDAVPNWRSQVMSRLERYKRYPYEARGDRGTVQVAFSVDRRGGVHHLRVTRSSGSQVLDREAMSTIQRANPLPPPPPEMRGSQIPVAAPIHYDVR